MFTPLQPVASFSKNPWHEPMAQQANTHDEHYRSLIEKMATGCEEALSEFYRAFEKRIYAFIQVRLNDSQDAADLLNDVMWQVWRGAARFEGRSSVASWVFGIAHYKVIDHIRSKKKQEVLDGLEAIDELESDQILDDIMLQKQMARHLENCINKLSPEQRQVVHLAFFEDFSYREIGEIVGRPEGTIKARMFHAKQALKRCLSRTIKYD